MNAQRNVKSDILAGLNLTEVERSRQKHGANVITKKKRKGFLSQYIASFGDPIIKILLIALGVNVVFMFRSADWYEPVGIAVAVLVATLVSTLSEYGSESAFEKLQQESGTVHCRVRRNNSLFLLPVGDLVVGDVVLLQAGERVPADGRIVSGELAVDQSALNGETREARKAPNLPSDENGLLSPGLLFRGGVVCSGEGAMVVDKVGDATFYGRLAVEIQEEGAPSPLKARLARLATTISKMGYAAAAVVAVANLFNVFVIDSCYSAAVILQKFTDLPFVLGALTNTVTLAFTVIVMSAPEGLPMMITVVLSANMKRMLKDNVLVRKLVGIETAGSLNILFTDKTGTLTKGKLVAVSFTSGEGTQYASAQALKKDGALWHSVIASCACNTDSAITGTNEGVVGGNGTDRALLEYVLPYIGDAGDVSLISHEPFSSEKKYSSSLVSCRGKSLYLIKGAPEIILPRCGRCLGPDGRPKPINTYALHQNIKSMGAQAIRMLALAQGDPGNPHELVLVGIMGIRDQIRRESRPAVAEITQAGVQVVMITGDNKDTAMAVAAEIGLLREGMEDAVYTSDEIGRMSDSEIRRKLGRMRVIARAMPSDKSRLVRIAQEMGLVTGMTGDGINDAPALKKADVGFAMGTGTEVAKEAGDIIILDNNISSISRAILYGRAIFKSIRKFIIFQLTMNLCAVGLSVICPFLGIDAPLTVMQMLWVNMIMDTLAGLAFSGEVPLKEYMSEPPKKRSEEIMNRYMYSQVLFTGLYTLTLCLLFLTLPYTRQLFRFDDGSDYFMTSFFALFIFAGVFNSLNARTYRVNLLAHLHKNKMFVVVMLLICTVQVMLIYFGGEVFRTVGITAWDLQIILVMTSTVIPADMLRKLWLRSIGRKGHL